MSHQHRHKNKLLLEFINYIIQSNPAFNRDLLNATESSKQLAFKSIMEKVKKRRHRHQRKIIRWLHSLN